MKRKKIISALRSYRVIAFDGLVMSGRLLMSFGLLMSNVLHMSDFTFTCNSPVITSDDKPARH